MKLLIFISLFCGSIVVNGQAPLQSPVFYYKSPFFSDTIPFKVGTTLQFEQRCTDKAPQFLYNETVGFEHFSILDLSFRLTVSFKDTLIYRTHYFYEGDNVKDALKLFQLDPEGFWNQSLGLYSYTGKRKNIAISCIISDKRLVYTEEIID